MGSIENIFKHKLDDEKVKFPVGFRFHPTDEELINQYLVKKVNDNSFCAIAIAEVDMNKCEPWDLPDLAKMGESEWYYFCVRDRKYPTGQRANRATNAGYWKATGKDKEIIKGNELIGMKKTLVFYKGRAPRGEKTNWVMHEYRLEGCNKISEQNLSKQEVTEWVLSRIYEKSNCGKKMYGSKFVRFNSSREGPSNANANESLLPQLMNFSPYNSETKTTIGNFPHILNSFSILNQTLEQNTQDTNIVGKNETMNINSFSTKQIDAYPFGEASQNCCLSQEILKMQLENENLGTSSNQQFSLGRDFDGDISSVVYGNNIFQRWYGNQESSPTSTGPMYNDGLWNF